MHPLLKQLVVKASQKDLVPRCLTRFIMRHYVMMGLRTAMWIAKDPFRSDTPFSTYEPKYPFTLGIIKEFWHLHWPYVAACRDLGVAYKVLDISGPDWIDMIERSGCDAFLVYPSSYARIWKQMYDERLKVMVEELGKIIYPTLDEIWLYESKRRMHYWLKAHQVPHPKTWIFYNLGAALCFAKIVKLPIVCKTDWGSGASGIKIIRKKSRLKPFIKKCFRKGFAGRNHECKDKNKERGCVLFQEYVPDAKEWRMIRLGDSYFGHQKLKKGDFHSGSHRVNWSTPPERLLHFARAVTEKGNFTSMNLDIFETSDGKYLVNELQALFGSFLPYQMRVNDKPGRYLYDSKTLTWVFEEGVFCRNASCNLRVEALLEKLRGTMASQ